MNGAELLRLGRTLIKLGEEAIPRAGFHDLSASARMILMDVFEHPNSSIGEITERTGLPQSLVSASVAKLREGGAFVTSVDPADNRRTLVSPSPMALRRTVMGIIKPIDDVVKAALDPGHEGAAAEVLSALETIKTHLTPAPAVESAEDAERRRAFMEALRPRSAQDFDAIYEDSPPWDIGRPQEAFRMLAEKGELRGKVLDIGCGTGEHALMAAGLGLDTTGIDLSPAAIAIAQHKASERGLDVRFSVGNALELAALKEQFDTVLDCGLFHVLDDAGRARYVDSLRAAVAPGGRYFMLCFSDRQPGDFGPRRIRQDEIRESFLEGWRVESIEESKIETNRSPDRVEAWLAAITRN